MHDKMGVQVIPLRSLTPYESKLFTLDLLKSMNPNDQQNKKNRGKLVVELTFDPFRDDNSMSAVNSDGEGNISIKRDVPPGGGVLLVSVENAEDVEGKRHTNPYAVVLFRGEKKETKVSFISVTPMIFLISISKRSKVLCSGLWTDKSPLVMWCIFSLNCQVSTLAAASGRVPGLFIFHDSETYPTTCSGV
jgi:hypothetical protein